MVADARASETLAEFVSRGATVISFAELAGRVGFTGTRMLDLARGESAAFGDVRAPFSIVRGGAVGGGVAGSGLPATTRHVENVEFTASGGLGGVFLGWVVGYVVAVHDIVVPITVTELQSGRAKAERAFPRTSFGRGAVSGQRKLGGVVVPRTKEVNGLNVRGCAKGERKLNGRGH